MSLYLIVPLMIVLILFVAGIRIVRPWETGLVEFLGRYTNQAAKGFNWIIPGIQTMLMVNMTEQMQNVGSQTVITKDKLNTKVNAVVFYKIMDPKKAMYNVDNHTAQLTSLAQTTLRSVIATKTLAQANEERAEINTLIFNVLHKETKDYGVSILRVEIEEITPPNDVQEQMNEVIKANQIKIAAKNLADAEEVKAEGFKRAAIRKAEGVKKSTVLQAEGKSQEIELLANAEAQQIEALASAEAKKIELESVALKTHFKGEAQIFKKLEVAEKSLKRGTKYLLDKDTPLTTVLSEVAGVTPIEKRS